DLSRFLFSKEVPPLFSVFPSFSLRNRVKFHRTCHVQSVITRMIQTAKSQCFIAFFRRFVRGRSGHSRKRGCERETRAPPPRCWYNFIFHHNYSVWGAIGAYLSQISIFTPTKRFVFANFVFSLFSKLQRRR